MPDFDPSRPVTDEQIRAVMRELQRRSQANQPRKDCVCRSCGSVVPNAYATKRYCSDACRVRANYWRKRAATSDDPTAPFRIPLQGLGWEDVRTYNRRKSPKRGKRP